jgi:hypothetical protein
MNFNSTILGDEKQDFAVEAGSMQPFKKSFAFILFGSFWIAFISIFLVAFFGPLLQGKEVEFESEGKLVVASLDNLQPLLMPAIIIGIFLFIGLVIVAWGLYCIFKKGGHFVATPSRLVHFNGNQVRSIDWEQFSGEIWVTGNAKKGDITLQLRTGHMTSTRNGSKRYVPDLVYLAAVPKPFELEQICRKRIKENDPTPSVA